MASIARVKTVRYLLAGKQVKKGTPGAVPKEVQSRKYYASGVPGWPAGKRLPLSSDKAAAERMLSELVRKADRGEVGMPDRDALRQPLTDLIDRFEQDAILGLAGRVRRAPDPAQSRLVAQRIRAAFITGCKFSRAADLNGSAPRELARVIRAKLPLTRAQGGWSHQTATFHLGACRRFVRWLAKQDIPVRPDLFDDIPGFDPKNHRVHARRSASPDELARVLAAAKVGRYAYGLTGPERYMLYLLAFATGFRRGELRRVAPHNFTGLGTSTPTVSLPGRQSKSKRAAHNHPLPIGVGDLFATYCQGRDPTQPVFPYGTWTHRSSRMLRRDLKAAGVDYITETHDGPKHLDFHALRHTFVSSLAGAGVGPKELQLLARHSTSALTMEVYTHANQSGLAAAVAKLPLPGDSDTPPTAIDHSATAIQFLLAYFLATQPR